nr:hypothetical protein [Tanacetum cinerariifolium]
VNTPRSDEDRHELMELTVFLLPKVEKVKVRVSAIDLQVSAVRHMLLLYTCSNLEKSKKCSWSVIDDVSNQGRMIADMDADVDVILEEAKDVAADAKADQVADVNENADIQGKTSESQAEIYKIDLDHANKVLSMQEEEPEPTKLQEVVDIVTTAKIITDVVTAASTTIATADVPIPAATTAAALKLTATPSRRRKGVVIRAPEESTTTSIIIHSEAKSKDKGKRISVEEPKPLKKQEQIEQDEKYARELEAELNRTIDWDKVIDHVNKKAKEDDVVKRYQAIKRKPQTEAQARKNIRIYFRNVAGYKMDYFKGISYDDIQEKATKTQKLDEEVEGLKRHLQIVPNDEDNVYTEATPLARKVHVVDYEFYNQNNKPYYKIKRARSVHGQAKVKSWKLLESCGV